MFISKEEARIVLEKLQEVLFDPKTPWTTHREAVAKRNIMLGILHGDQQKSWDDVAQAIEVERVDNMSKQYGMTPSDVRGEGRSAAYGNRHDENDGPADRMKEEFKAQRDALEDNGKLAELKQSYSPNKMLPGGGDVAQIKK